MIECALHVGLQLPRCRLDAGDLVRCETEAEKARHLIDEVCEGSDVFPWQAQEIANDAGRNLSCELLEKVDLPVGIPAVDQLLRGSPDVRPQLGYHPSREGSGERRASTAMSVAIRGQHAVTECIEQRAVGDAMNLGELRLGGAGPWVLAQPLDVGQPEDEVSTRLVRDQGMRPAVKAEYAVRIGVEPLSCENREIARGRAVTCLVNRINSFSHRSASVA